MTGFKSKRAAAQDKLEQWDMPSEAFNAWWDSDYDDSANPYETNTFAYWAWAGWQAALAQPAQEPVAWQCLGSAHFRKKLPKNADITAWNPLYTAPPQRPWVEPTGNEWFEGWRVQDFHDACKKPAQEPVAWKWRVKDFCDWPNWSVSLKRPADSGHAQYPRTEGYEDIPLYAHPPQRTWVDLTDDDCKGMSAGDKVVAMWANRILKKKNNG